jgi:putative membrane protein
VVTVADDDGRDEARSRPPDARGDREDDDPRVSFANERTMLAWVRTAIALMAGGAALAELSRARDGSRGALIPAATLVAIAAGLAAASIVLWRRREQAISARRPAPVATWQMWLLAAAIAAGAAASVVVAMGWT